MFSKGAVSITLFEHTREPHSIQRLFRCQWVERGVTYVVVLTSKCRGRCTKGCDAV